MSSNYLTVYPRALLGGSKQRREVTVSEKTARLLSSHSIDGQLPRVDSKVEKQLTIRDRCGLDLIRCKAETGMNDDGTVM